MAKKLLCLHCNKYFSNGFLKRNRKAIGFPVGFRYKFSAPIFTDETRCPYCKTLDGSCVVVNTRIFEKISRQRKKKPTDTYIIRVWKNVKV